MPPNSTAVAPVRLVPVMITEVPEPPVVGVKELITGTIVALIVIPGLDAIAGMPGNIMQIISKIKQPRNAHLLFFIILRFIK